MEEVGEVQWGQDFICDAGLNWQTLKVDEGWGDGLPGLGVGEDPGGRVLNILEPV